MSRNFGQIRAILAGLDYSTGDWVVVMDCDLQDKPEEILRLYQKAQDVMRSGRFLINPYTTDGKVVLGEQLKAITGFEADRHMPHSRRLYHLPRKEKRQGFLTLMAQSEEDDSDEV